MIKQRKVLIEKYNPEYPVHAMDDLFRELMRGCYEVKSNNFPNSIFFKKGDNVIMEQDLKNKQVWFNYDNIWSVFESQFGLEYQQIQEFLCTMLEMHLKLNGYIPEGRGVMVSNGFGGGFRIEKNS